MKSTLWQLDRTDPRAPSSEVWQQLSVEDREEVIDALPSEFPDAAPPEGDRHRKAKDGPLAALEAYFRKLGRKIYLSSNLPVYYPGERVFAPDLIAMLDVEPHDRDKWVVDAEGKGLDLALEVLYRGDDRKDLERNVERFATLGISEYFIYDRKRSRLTGYTLPEGATSYHPIVPQQGRWSSRVLGLELGLEGERIRLYAGTAPLPDWMELAMRGERLLAEAMQRIESAEQNAEAQAKRAENEAKRAEDEAKRAEDEAKRAEDEAKRAESEARRANELEAQLARLKAELERSKK